MSARAYGRLIELCAALGGAILVAVFLAIVYDVSARAMGYQPPYWTTPFTEYAMLYSTMLAGPWLVRRRGHIAVDAFARLAPAEIRRTIDIAVCLLCLVVSLLLAYYSAELAFSAWRSGEMDVRAANLPRWTLFAIMPPCFFLIAAEFARMLMLGERYLLARSDSQPGL